MKKQNKPWHSVVGTTKSVQFSSGPLIKSILASSAFLLVFSPDEMNGILLSDRGIIDNFPIEALDGISDKTIGIYINPMNNTDLSSTRAIMERVYDLSLGAFSLRKFNSLDVLIAPPDLTKLKRYSNLSSIKR